MALSYAHFGEDPVGYWYEAALPGRDAFAIRDASHQSIGAEILGLSKHNYNMMCRFAEGISESRDWCSFWEIDKSGDPCPVDYVDDNNFWYNLPANFEFTFGCWRLYEWTGDERYIKNPAMKNFFDRTFDEYIKKWQLEPEKIMNRPRFLNAREKTEGYFREARGIPSYDEGFPVHMVGCDMVAYGYAGFTAYANILANWGDTKKSIEAKKAAQGYYDLLSKTWWNEDTKYFYWGKHYDEKGLDQRPATSYILWVDACHEPDRIQGHLNTINTSAINVELLSYNPSLWYRYNYPQKAYDIFTKIISMERSEYPEVSYSMLEALINGAMGIEPSASKKKVVTLPKLPTQQDYAEVKDVPMLGGYVTVRHDGNTATEFTNNTPNKLTWQAAFIGEHPHIWVNGKEKNASFRTDRLGNKISYVEVKVRKGDKIQVRNYINKLPK
ncbi:MAG: hypothetical protein WCX81_00050 [Monoglobales bacterium]